MNDPAALASLARIDERTQNMSQTMTRVENALNEHKSATDKRFDDIMRDEIKPLNDKFNNLNLKVALLSIGVGGAGGVIGNFVYKMLGS